MKKVYDALGWHLGLTVSSKNQYLTMPLSCSHFVIVCCVRTAGGFIFPSEIKYDVTQLNKVGGTHAGPLVCCEMFGK